MLRNSRQNSPARAHFFDLLRHHWTEGTGNKVPGKWTASSFATEMGRAGIKSLDAKTMQAWLDGARWPGRARKDAILDVFFPDSTARPRSEEAKSARDAMEDAWRDGQSERSTSDVTAQDAHLGDDWIIEDPEHHTDIAAIELHQPTRTNSGNYHLDASVRFAPAQYAVDDVDLVVGLTEAFLSIATSGYAIAQKSLINERTTLPHFKPGVNGVTIIGPRDQNILSGNPVGDEHLSVIEPRGSAAPSVTIAVRAVRGNIAFAVITDPSRASLPTVQTPNRDAVIAAILHEAIPRDAQGRFILSSARMRRNKLK